MSTLASAASPSIEALIDRHEALTRPRLRMLHDYYRNPMSLAADSRSGASGARRSRLAQERGLPVRLVGASGRAASSRSTLAPDDRALATREIVIENDIAWRIQTMVDFMFGRPITIVSTAGSPALRRTIERILDAVWQASGGVGLLSDIGLLGHIYGHVDLIIRAAIANAQGTPDHDPAHVAAGAIRIEAIEPTRGIPILDPDDFRALKGYVIRTDRAAETVSASAAPRPRLTRWLTRHLPAPDADPPRETLTEILTPNLREVYLDTVYNGRASRRRLFAGPALIAEASAADAVIPVVHIQNISQPFRYEGISEVEPLIPLQDELNTRLSDRASRVTMQSFKMYLAKGLEGADRIPIGPGQIWSTDNPDASIQAFGGDAASPSEDAHIEQIREALDKASGVPPLASGVVRAKIGNLTSENALRVTLMGLLSKTARKRVTYGRGVAQACELILLALHRAGVLETTPADRAVRIEWPDPLPRDEREVLDAAQTKLNLGVPRERVLSELGYAPTDPGIV